MSVCVILELDDVYISTLTFEFFFDNRSKTVTSTYPSIKMILEVADCKKLSNFA